MPKVVGVLVPLLRDCALPWVHRTMSDATMAAKVVEDYIKHPRRQSSV